MKKVVPTSGPAFESMMHEIDRELVEKGLSIPQRPLGAIMAVGTRYGVPMPIGTPLPGMDPEVAQYAPLSEAINDWYTRAYGDRVKMDFSPGRMVVPIGGDLWTLRFPRIFGSVMFVAQRTLRKTTSNFSRGPVVSNIIELLDDMSPAKAESLTDSDLSYVYDCFLSGFHAVHVLEASSGHKLVKIARGNLSAAVEHLVHPQPQFGESKWASLQTAEKVLKAAIDLAGGKFPRKHDLATLCRQATRVGIQGSWQPLIDRIQCSPGVRYGEEPCDREQAIAAHHASLHLVNALTEGGAKFRSSLALR